MRYDYIDPFVATTLRVLDRTIRGTVRRGNVTVLEGERLKGDVGVRVRVTGDAEGDVILSMETATALRICSRLFGEHYATMTPGSEDALMEFANMITGNAISVLNDQGFDFTVSPPSVIRRGSASGQTLSGESMQIPLFSYCGEMTMNVALSAAY